MRITLHILLIFCCSTSWATGVLKGVVTNTNKNPQAMAQVVVQGTNYAITTNENGEFMLKNIPNGNYEVVVFLYGYKQQKVSVQVQDNETPIAISLTPIEHSLEEFEVIEQENNEFGIDYLNAVEGTAIYASKKNEVVLLSNVNGNKSTNNTREVYAKVAGLNIWESDAAGLQLGIGGRGLSPNRTSNFNTRQNGYDISADALGYPESYYSPPVEAVERIEVIRGAASLQYGTQFGGVLNFKLKKGTRTKPLQTTLRQTVGSFGLLNSFVSVEGTKGRANYYSFVQHKSGDGWRNNSKFNATTAHVNANYQVSERLNVSAEYTYMTYLAQQAGGLTDKEFYENARQSKRDRNWFNINWNLFALMADYNLSSKVSINTRFFGLLADRNALGELGRIDRSDPLENRDLISGDFKNIGNETRLLARYNLVENIPSAFLFGFRYYNGNTTSMQGVADDESDANFKYLENYKLKSDYNFKNKNAAVFAENVFNLSSKFSLTPGVRFEYINTNANGTYDATVFHPLTNEVLLDVTKSETTGSSRKILLAGLGASFKPTTSMETYGNVSQNYRAINFSDIKIVNPNFRVDNAMDDEKGYNADLGIRGRIKNYFAYDISAFYLRYNNRIGAILKSDTLTYQNYRYRTNVGNARNLGLETFIQFDFIKAFVSDTLPFGVSVFSNISFIDAQYISSRDASIAVGNRVELVPALNLKTGIETKVRNFKAAVQYSYVSEQFTEATNAVTPVPSAIDGLIPAYSVMDFSVGYFYNRYTVEAGINNLLNSSYFTRRATAYPGPGIIPSDGRSVYVTLQIRL